MKYGRHRPHAPTQKALRCELLEPRIALSGEGIAEFVAQPAGALDGKIVYTSAGHGLEYNNNISGFYAGRQEFASTEVNEAFGNQDQLYFFAEHLLRAGATVAPMRPVGHQLNEVVLDNDSPEVTYAGDWSNSRSSVFYDEDYGATTDSVSYRFASVEATETATATYTPDIPEAGFYPVYTWVLNSTNRTDQLYRIHDSAGGLTEIRVDHRMVGKGWVYLGTYHFDEGTSGSVEISNQSTAGGSVVIADAIRFGNGMGDLPDGPSGVGSGSISGAPREDEASLLWTYRAIGQGNSPSAVLGSSNVSAPHRMAEHMNSNSNPFGSSVYIGFHSNATGSHTARGAVGLIDQNNATPNQSALALYTGRQINQDMQALNGLYEHDWSNRTTHTFTSSFGEINLGSGSEMDATIIEVAFHDQAQDADLLNDPKVRDQLARSTYEAVVEYFSNFGGLADTTSLPSTPTGITATTAANGDVTVSWDAGPVGVLGGTPTAHRIYVSRDGYGYLGYDEVAAAGSGSHTFEAGELDDEPYYFKVVAVNSGGESPRSLVVAAQKSGPAGDRVLIVDGFDRNARTQNERYPDPFSGDPDGLDLVDRVRPRYNNTFDYSVQVAEAIAGSTSYLGIDTASNEAVIAGDVDLDDYEAVVWTLGEESTADDTFNATEQTLVTNYLAQGGKLMVSGAEIGWDLDLQNGGRTFYNNELKADYVGDDANTYNVVPSAGSIFAGLPTFAFDDGTQLYDVNFADRISPLGGATTALNYLGGSGGGAAIQFDGGATQIVNFGFPFETITSESSRTAVMDRVMEFFGLGAAVGDFDADNDVDGADFLAWQRNVGKTADVELADGDANGDNRVDGLDLDTWKSQYGQTSAPLQATTTAEDSTPSSSVSSTAELSNSPVRAVGAEFAAFSHDSLFPLNQRPLRTSAAQVEISHARADAPTNPVVRIDRNNYSASADRSVADSPGPRPPAVESDGSGLELTDWVLEDWFIEFDDRE